MSGYRNGNRVSNWSRKVSTSLRSLGIRPNSKEAILFGVVCRESGPKRVSVIIGHTPGNEAWAEKEATKLADKLIQMGYAVERKEHLLSVTNETW